MIQYHRVGPEYLSVTWMDKSRFDLFAYSLTYLFGIPEVLLYVHHISVKRWVANQGILKTVITYDHYGLRIWSLRYSYRNVELCDSITLQHFWWVYVHHIILPMIRLHCQ